MATPTQLTPRRFNGPDLWHSGTFNYSPAARLALTACFPPGPPWRLND